MELEKPLYIHMIHMSHICIYIYVPTEPYTYFFSGGKIIVRYFLRNQKKPGIGQKNRVFSSYSLFIDLYIN